MSEGRRDVFLFRLAFFLINVAVATATTVLPIFVHVQWLFVPFLLGVIWYVVQICASFSGRRKATRESVPNLDIVIMVPCYNESVEEIGRSIKSAIDSVGVGKMLIVVADGRVTEPPCEERALSLLPPPIAVEETTLANCACTSYRGFVNPDFPYMVIGKHANYGKRHSQLMVFELLTKNLPAEMMMMMGERQRNFDILFATDADSFFEPTTILSLASELTHLRQEDLKVVAVTSNVQVANYSVNFLTRLQQIEYFFGQFMTRQAESQLHTITCIPGACMMLHRDLFSWKNTVAMPSPIMTRCSCVSVKIVT